MLNKGNPGGEDNISEASPQQVFKVRERFFLTGAIAYCELSQLPLSHIQGEGEEAFSFLPSPKT